MRQPLPLLVFSFCLLVFFASCEEIIPVDPATAETQLILNAVPSQGHQLSVYFAHSRYFLDNSNNHPVDGVEMVVNVNGRDYRPDSVVRCSYYFPYTLQADDSLSVRVSLSGGHNVTARTYVPRPPQVTNLTALVDTSGTLGTDPRLGAFRMLAISFDLQDYPSHDDYYCITLSQRDSGSRYYDFLDRYDTVDTSFLTYFICLDRQLTSSDVSAIPGLGDAFFNRLLFSDKRIDGQNHSASIVLLLLRDTTEIEPFIHEYTLHIESVTPDRFRYLKDIATATSRMQIFSEPAGVYSNVNGALGIFAGNAHLVYPLSPDTLAAPSSSLLPGKLPLIPLPRDCSRIYSPVKP